MHIHQRFFWLLFLGLLVGCGEFVQTGSAVSASAKTGTLMDVDWANFTYTATCYGQTLQFQTQDGVTQKNGIHLQVDKPVFGDITGDGKDEAVIPYACAAADFGGVRAFVYSGDAANPTLLGNLPQPSRSKGEAWGSIDTIRIDGGKIYVSGKGYSAAAPRCCPDLQIEMRYRWDGKQFVVAD